MPYGLRNAPATFQRLMNRFCNANREKCHFASSRVKYLGFWITQKGIEVDPEKVASILDIPPPKNVKEVQSFLQTCSWFRRYIQDFENISRPLSYLTKKKVQWQWGFDQQNEFQTLKNYLTTPVLKQADGTPPYIIRTDARNYALGAVLLQGEGSDEHPIDYASRLLTPAERNYSTTEREALAVVWALKKFRGYIEGTEITVASDHQPLKWLLNLKSPIGRLARWALEIQSFNLKIQYIPGKANVVADMLSRPVTQEEESFCEANNITIADMPTQSCKDMREAQLKDDNFKKIIDSFESPLKTEEYANWTERGFLMNQGVLYRYVPDADSAEAQLVIPNAECELIMQRHHNDPMAGHYGEDGTFQKIAKRYYWTGMKTYISDYIKKCPECALFKATNQKPAGLPRTPVYSQKFEVIAIDLFGPLPKTDSASARQCSTTLIEEVSCVMAYQDELSVTTEHSFREKKQRPLKSRLAILVGEDHSNWHSKLPVIRFAMNTTVCNTTGHTPAYLLFVRELRTIDDVVQDFKSVVHNDTFVAEITPYLKRFATITEDIREKIETKQDQRKKQYDKNSRPVYYSPGDKVWVTLHPISNAKNKKTSKFMPKRDGPYLILTQKRPLLMLSQVLPIHLNRYIYIATYHTSALTPFKDMDTSPVAPLRKRGRPRKVTSTSTQNTHVPSTSTASTAISSRTIHPSTKATTSTANSSDSVSSPGRHRIYGGRL
ncbi:transposon Tf2-11 polyprotein [Trichonephila clavipes]|nr:transposon Tf2-11 polyprotein [Trichonephila clavipes]